MKRYLIFACCEYYPSGGSRDVRGEADTLAQVRDVIISERLDFYDEVEVLDMQERRWLAESEWAGEK